MDYINLVFTIMYMMPVMYHHTYQTFILFFNFVNIFGRTKVASFHKF